MNRNIYTMTPNEIANRIIEINDSSVSRLFSEDFIEPIAYKIAPFVLDELLCASAGEMFTDEELRKAVSLVICDHLGINY